MPKGLHLQCDFCKSPIEEPGGLLSTPIPGNLNEHLKEHICIKCSKKVEKILQLNQLGTGNAGIYWSPPIHPGSWNVHIKMLTEKELSLLRAELKKS